MLFHPCTPRDAREFSRQKSLSGSHPGGITVQGAGLLAAVCALSFAIVLAPGRGPAFAMSAEVAPEPPAEVPVTTTPTESLCIDAFRGQVVLLDFWASWCGPCRDSFPWMSALAEHHAGEGLAIVTVSVDKRRSDADAFLAKHPGRFHNVYDPDGHVASAFALKGMPATFLYDRDGVLCETYIGFRKDRAKKVEQRIVALLAAKATEKETEK